jgi:hypothetical protein
MTTKKVLPFNEEDDNELVSVVEEGLIIPPTEVNPRKTVPSQPLSLFKQLLVLHKARRIIRKKTPGMSSWNSPRKTSGNDRDNRFEISQLKDSWIMISS